MNRTLAALTLFALTAAGSLWFVAGDAAVAVVPNEVAPLAERLAGADTLVLGGISSTTWRGGGSSFLYRASRDGPAVIDDKFADRVRLLDGTVTRSNAPYALVQEVPLWLTPDLFALVRDELFAGFANSTLLPHCPDGINSPPEGWYRVDLPGALDDPWAVHIRIHQLNHMLGQIHVAGPGVRPLHVHILQMHTDVPVGDITSPTFRAGAGWDFGGNIALEDSRMPWHLAQRVDWATDETESLDLGYTSLPLGVEINCAEDQTPVERVVRHVLRPTGDDPAIASARLVQARAECPEVHLRAGAKVHVWAAGDAMACFTGEVRLESTTPTGDTVVLKQVGLSKCRTDQSTSSPQRDHLEKWVVDGSWDVDTLAWVVEGIARVECSGPTGRAKAFARGGIVGHGPATQFYWPECYIE
ncbi:MAG: hypothetical protein ACI8PZ_006741 [Myxococcota bacterium]|jgi:hypothetical protein